MLNFPMPEEAEPPGLCFPPFNGPLRGEDGQTLRVDLRDLPLLSRYRWHPGPEGYWTPFAKKELSLALLVLGPPETAKRMIHFQDGDITNCSRNNLTGRSEGVSRFLGAYPHKNRWIAFLNIQRVPKYLGLYDTPEDAARAHDGAALEIHGPKARLNFPVDVFTEKETEVNHTGSGPSAGSVIPSEVVERKGNHTRVRAYLARAGNFPTCELTLPTELFARINFQRWLLVEDSINHTRYRVKVSSKIVNTCRMPVYYAQEIR